ncbi:MAG: hypothetical protein JWR80_6948 [Bradyrhizobium sp.]|nr:hypothetical protein [Bradyrhizobium sp.]
MGAVLPFTVRIEQVVQPEKFGPTLYAMWLR